MTPEFRVWSKDLSKYRKLDDISNDQGLGMFFEVQKGIGSNVTSICYSINDVVEQFTGLTDVNGKDIYEGDVVRYTAWHDGKPTGAIQGEVVYDCDLGMASFNILLYRDDEIDRAVLPAIGVEAIGNVHENPELLEVEE